MTDLPARLDLTWVDHKDEPCKVTVNDHRTVFPDTPFYRKYESNQALS